MSSRYSPESVVVAIVRLVIPSEARNLLLPYDKNFTVCSTNSAVGL